MLSQPTCFEIDKQDQGLRASTVNWGLKKIGPQFGYVRFIGLFFASYEQILMKCPD